ncbi:MAG: glycerate kinase [Firmicutes bacterium]|nr:glycerate kinase [Bacillota bacterium]
MEDSTLKIILAPDSFKGSITATAAARAMAEGIREFFPGARIVEIPMSDGGEGLVQTLVAAARGRPEVGDDLSPVRPGTGDQILAVSQPADAVENSGPGRLAINPAEGPSLARILTREVTGPLGHKVEAFFGILGDGRTAVVEMAAASGLTLVPPEKRNPLITTTYGTGELILAAVQAGCRRIIVGIGGSATNDGGVGMAQALGIRFLDQEGREIGPGGRELARIALLDVSGLNPVLNGAEIDVACDVNNPLTGPRGAAAVYGPQKGATPAMVQELDAALNHLAAVIRRDLGKDAAEIPGAGAAGGLGAGLMAFLDARLRPGMDLVLEVTGFREQVTGADLVITGEGRVDSQTLFGKVPCGVARAAKEHGVPVVAIAGSLGDDVTAIHSCGIDAFFSLTAGPTTLEEAMQKAASLLAQAAGQVVRLFAVGRGVAVAKGKHGGSTPGRFEQVRYVPGLVGIVKG